MLDGYEIYCNGCSKDIDPYEEPVFVFRLAWRLGLRFPAVFFCEECANEKTNTVHKEKTLLERTQDV